MATVSAHCGKPVRGAKSGTNGLGRWMDRHSRRHRCGCSAVCLHLLGTYCVDCGRSV